MRSPQLCRDERWTSQPRHRLALPCIPVDCARQWIIRLHVSSLSVSTLKTISIHKTIFKWLFAYMIGSIPASRLNSGVQSPEPDDSWTVPHFLNKSIAMPERHVKCVTQYSHSYILSNNWTAYSLWTVWPASTIQMFAPHQHCRVWQLQPELQQASRRNLPIIRDTNSASIEITYESKYASTCHESNVNLPGNGEQSCTVMINVLRENWVLTLKIDRNRCGQNKILRSAHVQVLTSSRSRETFCALSQYLINAFRERNVVPRIFAAIFLNIIKMRDVMHIYNIPIRYTYETIHIEWIVANIVWMRRNIVLM